MTNDTLTESDTLSSIRKPTAQPAPKKQTYSFQPDSVLFLQDQYPKPDFIYRDERLYFRIDLGSFPSVRYSWSESLVLACFTIAPFTGEIFKDLILLRSGKLTI